MRRESVNLPSEADAILSPTCAFQLEAHACYRALAQDASETGFGGKLLYAGELDPLGCSMMVAGNVAGCATLAVTAEDAAQKRAIRDGVADFLVTSLDEGLRILKNEIRKRKNVSVCIGAERSGVEREMVERGVLPDVVFAGDPTGARQRSGFGNGVREIRLVESRHSLSFLTWQVPESPARWMPKLDSIALECLTEEPWTQRWIRLSPRYLGRVALAQRAFYCEPQAQMRILRGFAAAVEQGAIAAQVSLTMIDEGESKVSRLRPPSRT